MDIEHLAALRAPINEAAELTQMQEESADIIEVEDRFVETSQTKSMTLTGFQEVQNSIRRFLVSEATPIEKLMGEHCKLTNLVRCEMWFFFDGVKELSSNDVLEEGDVIYVHDKQYSEKGY